MRVFIVVAIVDIIILMLSFSEVNKFLLEDIIIFFHLFVLPILLIFDDKRKKKEQKYEKFEQICNARQDKKETQKKMGTQNKASDENKTIQELVDGKIKEIDPNFDKDELYRYVNMLFCKYNKAIKMQDWEVIDSISTKEFALKCKSNFDKLSFDKDDELDAIKKITITNVEKKNGRLLVTVSIAFDEKNIEYNSVNQNKIKGLSGYKFSYTCEMILEKLLENNQELDIEKKKKHCPNCGAPTTILTVGRCNYCNKIIRIEEDFWKIAKSNLFQNKKEL